MGIVIGLGYKYKSGKDTLADYLVEEYGFTKLAFAERLKEACKVIFGFSDEQVYGRLKSEPDEFWCQALGREVTPGDLLQKIGTEGMRQVIHPDVWARALQREVETLRAAEPDINIVISDVRFHNEANVIRGALGGVVVRIDRADRDLGGRDPNHASEVDLDDYPWYEKGCLIVDNNGPLEQLYQAGDYLVEEFVWGRRPVAKTRPLATEETMEGMLQRVMDKVIAEQKAARLAELRAGEARRALQMQKEASDLGLTGTTPGPGFTPRTYEWDPNLEKPSTADTKKAA